MVGSGHTEPQHCFWSLLRARIGPFEGPFNDMVPRESRVSARPGQMPTVSVLQKSLQ